MVMRHPGKIEATDQVIDTEGVHEALYSRNAVLRITDYETVCAQRFKCHWRLVLGTNQGMFPATTIFITIIHHHVFFSKLPGTFTRFGNHYFPSKRRRNVSRIFAGAG